MYHEAHTGAGYQVGVLLGARATGRDVGHLVGISSLFNGTRKLEADLIPDVWRVDLRCVHSFESYDVLICRSLL